MGLFSTLKGFHWDYWNKCVYLRLFIVVNCFVQSLLHHHHPGRFFSWSVASCFEIEGPFFSLPLICPPLPRYPLKVKGPNNKYKYKNVGCCTYLMFIFFQDVQAFFPLDFIFLHWNLSTVNNLDLRLVALNVLSFMLVL